MRKKTKHGVNSGNTLYLGEQAFRCRYGGKYQNIIVKTLRNLNPFHNDEETQLKINSAAQKYVPDGGLVHAPVDHFWGRVMHIEFSMNKKKRWHLPAIIKASVDEIKEDHKHDKNCHNPVNISLVERNLSRISSMGRYSIKNSCVSYHTSASPNMHVLPKKTFAFEADLKDKSLCNDKEKYEKSERAQKKKKRKVGHNQHFRQIQRRYKNRRRQRKKMKKRNNTDENPQVPDWVLNAHRPRNAVVRNADDDEQQLDEIFPTVHYEVCYPHRNVIAHKSYYHSSFDYSKGYYTPLSKARKKCKSLRSENIEENTNIIRDGMDAYFALNTPADYVHDEGDLKLTEDKDPDYCTRPRSPLTFKEVLDVWCSSRTCPSPRKKRVKSGSIQPSNTAMSCQLPTKYYGKGNTIFCGEESKPEDVSQSSPVSPVNSSLDFEMVSAHDAHSVAEETVSHGYCSPSPILLPLLRGEISEQYLQSAFGDFYMECHTLPRGFVLDLSEELIKCLADSQEDFKINVPHGMCEHLMYLIFEESKVKKEMHKDSKLFWVFVGGDYEEIQNIQSAFTLHIQQLEVNCPMDIKTLIESLFRCAQEAPGRSHIVKRRNVVVKSPTQDTCSWKFVKNLQGWDSGTYPADEAYKLLEMETIPEQTQVSQMTNPSELQIPSRQSFLRTLSHVEPMDYCDICYDSLISTWAVEDSEMETLDMEGIALSGCQHWYCKSCWRRHLMERINYGDVHIKCPGFKCDELISPAMIIMTLPLAFYKKHISHIGESRLEMSRIWKWCPSKKCGRVAKITKLSRNLSTGDQEDPRVDVLCQCGALWCFGCQKEAHWPLTCAQGSVYYKMIKQKGTNETQPTGFVFFVDVKKCPLCRYPIEKNGGCQHMHCHKCATDFCWECLGLWRDHGTSLRCPKVAAKLTTVELSDEQDVKMDKFYTKKALEIRTQRKEMATRIKRLHREVKANFSQISGAEYWNAHKRDDGSDQNVKSAWCFMLEGLYIQEHIYVLLSNCTRRVRSVTLLTELDRFCFILHVLQKMLLESVPQKNFEQRLNSCVSEGKLCAGYLIHKVNKAQRKLKKSLET